MTGGCAMPPISDDDPEREKLVRELEAAIAAGDKEREKRAREALALYDIEHRI
jgi:hypothetical protein